MIGKGPQMGRQVGHAVTDKIVAALRLAPERTLTTHQLWIATKADKPKLRRLLTYLAKGSGRRQRLENLDRKDQQAGLEEVDHDERRWRLLPEEV